MPLIHKCFYFADFEQIVCSLRGMKLHEIVRELADINFFGLIDKVSYIDMFVFNWRPLGHSH